MSTKPLTDTAGHRDAEPTGLSALRAELDRIDDAIHDLLIERSHVVSRVSAEGRKAYTPYRPGREAVILRRLLARHTGPLGRQGLVRVWRELISAGTAMQGGHMVAVCDPDVFCGYTQLAREQFGALVPLRVYRSPGQALNEVVSGLAGIAVLPVPSEADSPHGAWWTVLLHRGCRASSEHEPRLHIVARLPFWSPRPEGASHVQALTVSLADPDPSGEDRSLLGMELARDSSRAGLADALSAAGLPPRSVLIRNDGAGSQTAALAEVDGFLSDTDPRLKTVQTAIGSPVVLGAYAVPVGEAR